MASDVANINRVLLVVFGILRADPEDKTLLCQHRDCWQGDSQTHQCNSRYWGLGICIMSLPVFLSKRRLQLASVSARAGTLCIINSAGAADLFKLIQALLSGRNSRPPRDPSSHLRASELLTRSV